MPTRPSALLTSIVISMVVWTTVIATVTYMDFRRTNDMHISYGGQGYSLVEFLAEEALGYGILWVIGLTSMTVMRLRLRRYLDTLVSVNTHLAADRMRSEKAESIASFGHWELDLKNKTFRGSGGAAVIYGLAENAWSVPLVQSIPLPEYRPVLDRALADLIAGTGPYDVEFKIRRLTDGCTRDIHSIAVLDRTLSLVTGVIHDVTEYNAAQRQLQESENRYRLLADHAIDVIWTTDLNGHFTYISPSIQQLRGVTPEEVLNLSLEDVICAGSLQVARDAIRAVVEDAMAGRNSEPTYLEVEQPRKDGTTVWTEVTTRIIFDPNGIPLGMVGSSRDVSLRRRYREQLEISLRDKDVLLREVHHRVKNNLQVICSLLNLQAESYHDKQTRTLLKESQQRIRSMALVHEKLYRSPHVSHIDFSDYLSSMTHDLLRSFGNGTVHTKIEGENIYLDIEKAIPAGLIVNELLTNALKHAFPEGHPHPEIHVHVHMDGELHVALTVQDNGVGLPTGIAPEEMKTMGMTVINGLTQQLDGTIGMIPGTGAGFRLRFPLVSEE
jgi:PAS domain S-box-containing protein